MSLTSALGGITSVAGKVGSIAGVAGGIANNITALIGESVSNTEIRERYLSGFLGNTSKHTPNVFIRRTEIGLIIFMKRMPFLHS